MDALLRIVMFVGIGVAYLIPAFMAHAQPHPRERSIILLNLLTGWTGIGWLAALIWAVSGPADSERPHISEEAIPDHGFCSHCGSSLEAGASFCCECGAPAHAPAGAR